MLLQREGETVKLILVDFHGKLDSRRRGVLTKPNLVPAGPCIPGRVFTVHDLLEFQGNGMQRGAVQVGLHTGKSTLGGDSELPGPLHWGSPGPDLPVRSRRAVLELAQGALPEHPCHCCPRLSGTVPGPQGFLSSWAEGPTPRPCRPALCPHPRRPHIRTQHSLPLPCGAEGLSGGPCLSLLQRARLLPGLVGLGKCLWPWGDQQAALSSLCC